MLCQRTIQHGCCAPPGARASAPKLSATEGPVVKGALGTDLWILCQELQKGAKPCRFAISLDSALQLPLLLKRTLLLRRRHYSAGRAADVSGGLVDSYGRSCRG